jgi:cell division transport system permease protein
MSIFVAMANKEERYSNRRYQSSYVTTVVSITLVLLMLGVLALIVLHARKLSDYVKENIGFRIYMKENAKEADIIQFQKILDASAFVKSTEYITSAQAAKELSKELGEDFIDFLGYNPLPPSIDLRVKAAYANVDSLEMIDKKVMANPDVKEVFYQKSLVHLINQNIRRISIVLLAFSALLMLISIALINNTIRLSVYSRRFIIRTMKLVGATQSFIRRPFIWKGIIQGLYAAIIAILLLGVILYFSQQEIPELVNLRDFQLYLTLFGLVVLLGIIISWISTFFAVRKYLRMKEDDLYF